VGRSGGPPRSKREERIMKKRSTWLIGAAIVAASMTLAGVAIATPSTGSVVSEVIGAGSTSEPFRFTAKPELNTVVARFTFGPNSSTGWHTHPGRTLVTVKSGTFTVYHADDCAPMVYEPGDAFVELPTTVHVGRNETSEPVELGVVFFRVPIGGSPRIDQPQPSGCEIT
jgi:quercetin dioxygenase-like cupin family protein